MRTLVAATVLLLGACGYEVDQSKVVPAPDGADEATAIVMDALTLSYRPDTYWYAPDDCGAGAIHDPAGDCVFGFRIDETVVLSTQDGAHLHETALAHEYGHLASLERDGNSDHCHQRRYFLDPGITNPDCKITPDDIGLIGAANRALAAAGK